MLIEDVNEVFKALEKERFDQKMKKGEISDFAEFICPTLLPHVLSLPK